MHPLILIAIAVVYLGGAWKFWQGFGRTNFTQQRFLLTMGWPVLLVVSKPYRQNFNKALKG